MVHFFPITTYELVNSLQIVFEEAQQFSVHFRALVLGYFCEIMSLKARLICFIYHVAHIYSVEI